MNRSWYAWGMMLALGMAGGQRAQAALFQGLGDLPGDSYISGVYGLSSDGSTAVGYSRSANGLEAFRWTQADGMVGLGDLAGGGFYSKAFDAAADGSIIIGQGISDNGPEAYRWTQADGMVGLGDLPGGAFSSWTKAISDDGSVVIGASVSANGGLGEAYRWTQADGMVALGDLPGGAFDSIANALSADGSIIVGQGVSDMGPEAFRWTMPGPVSGQPGGMVGLGDLPGGIFQSGAYATSADGSVIVGAGNSESGTEAFRWTQAEGMVGLGDLPGGIFWSSALGISADGSVVVGFSYSDLYAQAFIWDQAHGMRSLYDVLANEYGLSSQLQGWNLQTGRDLSADGTIITGSGYNPNGEYEPWIVDLNAVPEPAAVVILLIGITGLIASRRGTQQVQVSRDK